MVKAVFLDQQTFSSDASIRQINQRVDELVCWPITLPHEVVERSKDANIIITNKVILNDNLLSQLPNLKLICIAATGTNNVDLASAKKRGIAVTNVSGYAKNSVAQYVIAQLLLFYSQPHHHNHNVKQGLWQQSATFCYHGNGSEELAGKTIGLIGYGDLAKAVEKIALAFDMKILIAERPNSVTLREGRVPFSEVLKKADIISLHCPHTKDTEDLINEGTLSIMKKSAVLINTARGALVNEKALQQALLSNDIAYAVLDVLKQEPPAKDHILLTHALENIAITAHIAWASIEAQQRLLDLIACNIAEFKKGIPTNRV